MVKITEPTKYSLILADPPWHFRNWSGDKSGKVLHSRTRGANKHYITQHQEEICNIKPPVADDALLLIWTISSHLEDTFQVIREWGFQYKTIAWVWVKTKNNGTGVRIGGGYYYRQCTELCLLATRGTPPERHTKGEPAILFAPRGKKHSGKPAEQYVKIDKMWPDLNPRLELFARTAQPGWDVWGNEADTIVSLPNQDDLFIAMPEAAK